MKHNSRQYAVDGIVRTGRPLSPNSPHAGHSIGYSAGLMARLLLLKLVRSHATGDSLPGRHATYCEPLACERNEPAMIHRRFPLEFEHPPALRVDVE